MTPAPICILYTHDSELVRRARAFLRSISQVRHVSDLNRLEPELLQTGPSVLLMDLRSKESQELIEQIQNEHPEALIIALGVAQSETLREAERYGIYATEEIGVERRSFQTLLGRAFDHLKLLQENHDLRERSIISLGQPQAEQFYPPFRDSPRMSPALRFPRVLRRLDNLDAMLSAVIEALADAAGVSRVGIFSRARKGDPYRFSAGLHCLPETDELQFSEREALVRWFELNAHLISRANVARTQDAPQRTIMRRALDMFGAEAVVPLFARGSVIGWIFFGHRVTGQPFRDRDLEGLTMLGEQVATILENALLFAEATVHKTLAET